MTDRPGDAYALAAFRRGAAFGETFVAALRAAGVDPDSFLAEYGPRQFEVTVAPQPAMVAADQAVITRELARATAARFDARAIFSPKLDPDGVGNGVHIHMSLTHRGKAGRPPMRRSRRSDCRSRRSISSPACCTICRRSAR